MLIYALNHDFFWTDTLSISLDMMLSNHGHSMFRVPGLWNEEREGDAAQVHAAAWGVHGQGVLGQGGGDDYMIYIFVFKLSVGNETTRTLNILIFQSRMSWMKFLELSKNISFILSWVKA